MGIAPPTMHAISTLQHPPCPKNESCSHLAHCSPTSYSIIYLVFHIHLHLVYIESTTSALVVRLRKHMTNSTSHQGLCHTTSGNAPNRHLPLGYSALYYEGGSGTTPQASRTRRGNQDPPSMRPAWPGVEVAWQKGSAHTHTHSNPHTHRKPFSHLPKRPFRKLFGIKHDENRETRQKIQKAKSHPMLLFWEGPKKGAGTEKATLRFAGWTRPRQAIQGNPTVKILRILVLKPVAIESPF